MSTGSPLFQTLHSRKCFCGKRERFPEKTFEENQEDLEVLSHGLEDSILNYMGKTNTGLTEGEKN